MERITEAELQRIERDAEFSSDGDVPVLVAEVRRLRGLIVAYADAARGNVVRESGSGPAFAIIAEARAIREERAP